MPVIKTGRSQFIEKLHKCVFNTLAYSSRSSFSLLSLLEHSPDSESLRWISTEAFEITCDDASACQVLKPAWDFKSYVLIWIRRETSRVISRVTTS